MPARANTRLTDARAHRRYTPPKPEDIRRIELSELLRYCDRNGLSTDQFDLLRSGETSTARDVNVFYAGDLALLKQPCVSVVGTREVSPDGRQRAARLTRELVGAGITVVSGLARGVDTVAHTTAIEFGGATVGVPGTPLDRASPADNALLQEEMYRRHLLLTPFASASRVYRSNFPTRNRLMAAVSDATVIVEASDTSGTLYQAVACQKLGRWLFILRSVVESGLVKWPARFLGQPKTAVLSSTTELMDALELR